MDYSQNTRGIPKPVKIGKEYTIEVTDTGRGRNDITRASGLTIFIKKYKLADKNIKI
jgi:predicted RNA-binding protein with TRAM domain